MSYGYAPNEGSSANGPIVIASLTVFTDEIIVFFQDEELTVILES